MSYWANKQKRLLELSKLRLDGYTWKEIKESTSYDGNVETLRRIYNESDLPEVTEHPVKLLQQRARAQQAATVLRKDAKLAISELNRREDLLEELKRHLPQIQIQPIKRKENKKGKSMICEVLISDIQIGKVTPDFNTEICYRRMKKHGEAVVFKILQHEESGYRFEKIILSFMGDIIESSEKASKKGTALSVDSYSTEQIVNSIKGIFENIICPIASLGIPLEVIGVPGNHDHRDNGMPMDKAGIICDTWTIYKVLEMLCDKSKLNTTFNITTGTYAIAEVFGQSIVYEHGYGLSVSEASLLNRLNQRSRQEKKHITYFRMGDKHTITRFNEDQLVVNGAYFGQSKNDKGDDYSSAMGFASRAGQIVFFHVPRLDDDRLTCYDSFIVQLSHVK